MRTATYQLTHPIILEKKGTNGELLEEEMKPAGHTVVLRRPKAKDLRAFDQHGEAAMAGVIELIKRCSNLDDLEVENLDADDFEHLGNVLVPDLKSGPKTGASD